MRTGYHHNVIHTSRICSVLHPNRTGLKTPICNTNYNEGIKRSLSQYYFRQFNTTDNKCNVLRTRTQFHDAMHLLRPSVPSSCAPRFQSTQHDREQPDAKISKANETVEQKKTLWQKFKQMYKEYWYVLVPVHLVTSTVWYGSFYYIARSGIDIVPILENMGMSETILKPLRDTGAGYFAVAYAMYKIATPARYTVTLGGTTITINYLKKWGYIKPMPSGEKMKEMIREKGRQLRSRRARVLAKMNLRRKGSAKVKSSETPKSN